MNKIMIKKILITSLIVLGGFLLVGSVWAATNISFSPTSINVSPGENFNLTISLNPQGIRNYTVKTEVSYPADLVEIKSFNFGQGWTALSQTGYDLVDNTNGLLIKTAGYPGGIPISASFGTISFSAKKAGSGTISLGSNSIALDAENQNVLSSSLAQASVKITAPAAPSTPPSTPTSPTTPEEITEEEITPPIEEGEEVITPEEEKPAEIAEEPSFLAAIGNVITFGTGNALIGVIVSIIALLILFFIVRGVRLRKSK